MGLGLIAAFLKSSGIPCRLIDLTTYAGPQLALTAEPIATHRSRRAARHIREAVDVLRTPAGYEERSRYRSSIEFYASALQAASANKPWHLTPSDFIDSRIIDFGPWAAEKAVSIAWETPWIPVYDEVLAGSLDQFLPTLVGISVTYRPQFLPALSLAAWLRRHAPSLPVVWGGPFLDSLPKDTLAWMSAFAGTVIQGPGEQGLARILRIPPPAAGLFRDPCFDDLDHHSYFSPLPVVPLAASRGCVWRRCAFCAESTGQFCADGLDELFARIARLADCHQKCLIHFTDNAIPPATLSALAARGAPAPWYGFVRPTAALADYGLVQALADSGCSMLQLGLETASQGLLDHMRKGVDSTLYPSILANLRRAGIKSYAYLLFGFPGEGEADREETLRFCAEHPADFLNASLFSLPPNAVAARDSRDFDLDLIASPGDRYLRVVDDTRPRLRRWLSGSFLRHPTVRTMATRTPRYFKSSHAPFL
ncbi:radical SAM protein [Candidatus Fermentibacteria bacterium]|nr:radical SAM protein [Candidatus Fermentibacteria bacterium]